MNAMQKLYRNDAAATGLSAVGAIALTTAAIVIAAVVGLTILANLFPAYSDSVRDISENFSTADWGDETANSLGPTFALVVSLGGLFAVIGLVFLAYRMRT